MEGLRQNNVVAALSKIMEELPGIGKDQRASQQQGGYAYRGIEQITKALQPLLAKHGVVIVPREVEWRPVRELVVNNKPWTDEGVLVTYRIYGPGGIEDHIDVCVPGIGRDNSDKGTNKALTQAFKYALIQTFCISDPNDDADGTTHQVDTQEPGWLAAPREAIEALQERVGGLEPEILEWFRPWKDDQAFPWPWPAEAVEAMNRELDRLEAPSLAPLAGPTGDGVETCRGCGQKFTKTGQHARDEERPEYATICKPF